MIDRAKISSDVYLQLFMDFFKDSPDPFITLDANCDGILFVNDAFKKLYGLKSDKLSELIAKDDLPSYELFKEDLSKLKTAILTCRLAERGANPIDSFLRAQTSSDGAVFAQVFDISSEARKKEEESQKKWIGYFERLFANSKDIMNLFSMTQRKILRWNPQAGVAMGYTKEDLENVPIEKIYPPEEIIKLGDTFEKLAKMGFAEAKLKIYRKGRDNGDIWIRAFVVQYEPEVLCLVHTIDISDEKERERILLKETRLAALGEASASLAHEINNSLQSIQFNLYLLKEEKARLPEDCFSRLEKIETNVTHIGSVVRNIQNYTHFSRFGKSNVFLSSIVESSLQILEGYIQNRQVELCTEIERNLPPIGVDPNQIQQIVLILLKNAVQALVNSPVRKITITAKIDDSHHIILSIKDSGSGMPEEVKRHLFESFVTTKPIGVGLGLGLSVAKKLATANGVTISFNSEVGVGTEFILAFNQHASDEHREAAKVLLYVDDKDSLFPSFEEYLSAQNITVIRSRSAKEAIGILMSNHIDLIMCAENMYPVSGYAFLKEAAHTFKGPMCLTQDSHNPLATGGQLELTQHVEKLQYPCDVQVFSQIIASMLSQLKPEESS